MSMNSLILSTLFVASVTLAKSSFRDLFARRMEQVRIQDNDEPTNYCDVFNSLLPGLQWADLDIPVQITTKHVPELGEILFEAKHIQIEGPKSIVCSASNKGSIQTMEITNGPIQIVNLDWRVHQTSFPYLTETGSMHGDTLADATIYVDTSVPNVRSDTLVLHDVNVQFTGGAESVLNALNGIIKLYVVPQVQTYLEKQIVEFGEECLADISNCLPEQ